MGDPVGLVVKTMHDPAFGNKDKRSLPRGIITCLGPHFDLPIDHIKGFMKTSMRMRTGTAARRNEHVDRSKGSAGFLSADKDAVGIPDNGYRPSILRAGDNGLIFYIFHDA